MPFNMLQPPTYLFVGPAGFQINRAELDGDFALVTKQSQHVIIILDDLTIDDESKALAIGDCMLLEKRSHAFDLDPKLF
ncbi:hypothetical protein H261_20764 [Paramagnetospirillum caucaseum]|uniref:Uncharacterized protein n=1 Tax=Paramagnetospirillum caucaseum TaxID=1244869 RepID=M3A571_9PROT|nr:hypothetical protein H261_20764 [Paramagnetospirillum caucaseum]